MRIVRIHIDGFGKLHQFDLQLKEGMNLVIGANEAGKSTLHLFLRSMLYGADKKRRNGQTSAYESMRPWKDPHEYGGRLEIEEDDGSRWMIARNFDRAANDLEVIGITEKGKKTLSSEEGAAVLQRLLKNLSETAYVNTVSAGQLSAATERGMSQELRRYAANVSTTANPQLNADRAIELLKDEKKKLEASLDPEAAKEYTGLVSAARKLEENLDRPEYENNILNIAESGRRAEAAAEKLGEQLRTEDAAVSERQELLTKFGLGGRDLIEKTRAKVLQDYGRWQVLTEQLTYKRSPLSLLLIVIAVIFGALAWKFRAEYLFVVFLICAAGCLAAALMILYGRYRTEDTRDKLEEHLEEEFFRYTGSRELNEETLHLFENRMFDLRKAAEELETARSRQGALQSEMDRLGEEQKANRTRLDQQREAKAKVEDGLRELNSMQAEAAVLRKKLSTNDLLRDRIEALDLAIETMEQLKEGIGSAVGTYINKEASRMVEGLTGGAYTSVNAGRQYNVSLNSHDGMIPIESLSAGTADQVYLALRLATIRFITGEEDAVPLILDDSFALYDDERLRKAVRFLAENYRGQILIFSCQRREEEALQEEGLPYHLIVI